MVNLVNLFIMSKMAHLVQTVKIKLTEIMMMIKLNLTCLDCQKATT